MKIVTIIAVSIDYLRLSLPKRTALQDLLETTKFAAELITASASSMIHISANYAFGICNLKRLLYKGYCWCVIVAIESSGYIVSYLTPYQPVLYIHRPQSWPALSLIASFMGPTWGPTGADRTQVGPMLAPWTLLSGVPNPTMVNH